MIVVDTSVWFDFFRRENDRLAGWIASDALLQHPYVTAEVGMGSFGTVAVRDRTLDLLQSFTQAAVADDDDFHRFVADQALFGTGLGFADAHLLLTVSLQPTARLWTRDKRLAEQASRLGLEVVA